MVDTVLGRIADQSDMPAIGEAVHAGRGLRTAALHRGVGPDGLGRVDADQADVPLLAVLQIDLESVPVHRGNDLG